MLGWLAGTVFFYGSCYWLTYSMIHYGGLPTVVAYLLVVPPSLVVGIFPGLFALVLAVIVRRWGPWSVLSAPAIWPACEWARLGVTGQLWNALGYSLAYQHTLIQPAQWGGVYAVSFLLVGVNATIVLLLLKRDIRATAAAVAILALIGFIIFSSQRHASESSNTSVHVIALQPNVPMTLEKTTEELAALRERHLTV